MDDAHGEVCVTEHDLAPRLGGLSPSPPLFYKRSHGSRGPCAVKTHTADAAGGHSRAPSGWGGMRAPRTAAQP